MIARINYSNTILTACYRYKVSANIIEYILRYSVYDILIFIATAKKNMIYSLHIGDK